MKKLLLLAVTLLLSLSFTFACSEERERPDFGSLSELGDGEGIGDDTNTILFQNRDLSH